MFNEDDVENPLEQISQMCGFSPVWVLKCLVNSEGLSNSLPQCSQGSIVRFLIFLICCGWCLVGLIELCCSSCWLCSSCLSCCLSCCSDWWCCCCCWSWSSSSSSSIMISSSTSRSSSSSSSSMIEDGCDGGVGGLNVKSKGDFMVDAVC